MIEARPVLFGAFAKAVKPRKRLSVSAWADAHRVLSSKGSSEPGRWRTSRVPFLQEPMDCLSQSSPVKKVVIMKSTQVGFALDCDTPVPTPKGWTTMGDIQVGDVVFGDDGKPVKVKLVSEVFENHDCYKVTFCDGEEIIADASHRWRVDCRYSLSFVADRFHYRERQGVLTTEEMSGCFKKNGRNQFSIPLASRLHTRSSKLPIHPYVLGMWLADGNNASNQLTSFEDDAEEIAQRFMSFGVTAEVRHQDWVKGRTRNIIFGKKVKLDGVCIRNHVLEEVGVTMRTRGSRSYPACNACARQHSMAFQYGHEMDPVIHTPSSMYFKLKQANLIKNKHIPKAYLRASYAQRLLLLQGLFDGDGTVGKSGFSEFNSVNKSIADAVVELLCSVGLKPRLRLRELSTLSKGIDGKFIARQGLYRVVVTAYRDTPLFLLERKRKMLKDASDGRPSEVQNRRIVDISPVDTRPVRCIGVDNESHLFLCGKRMVATHNTEAALNWIGYVIHHAPSPLLIVYPSLEVRDRVIAQRINPLLEETPELEALIHAKAKRTATNAKDMKDFAGGMMVLSGANSPSSLGSMPVRYVICDEVDRFPWQVGSGDKSEGDPISLIEARQANFPRRKMLMISSPTIKGHSHIDEAYEGGDKRQYTMPCPHCAVGLVFRWKGLHWTAFDGVVKEVWYVCEHCGAEIKEFDKPEMLAQGKWVAQKPKAAYRSYHINGLYSPIGLGFTWLEIVDKWLHSHKDLIKLKSFVNTVLGEAWEDQANELKPSVLMQRAEEYPTKTVPKDCLLLTCGIDTQDDRLAFLVLGHGRDGVSWVIDWLEIPGKPDRMLDEAAKKEGVVYDYLSQPFRNTYGKDLFIAATAIDTGGHHTHDVYSFVRSRCVPRLMAIKGSSIANKPVLAPRPTAQDVNRRGKKIKGGVMLWMVGGDSAKHVLVNRLVGDAGLTVDERKLRFPAGLDEDFYKQLIAEVFDPEKNRWVKRRGRRNEATDCFCYALAASQHPELRVQSKRVRDWQALARVLQPEDAEQDAEVANDEEAETTQTPVKRRRAARKKRGSFASKW